MLEKSASMVSRPSLAKTPKESETAVPSIDNHCIPSVVDTGIGSKVNSNRPEVGWNTPSALVHAGQNKREPRPFHQGPWQSISRPALCQTRRISAQARVARMISIFARRLDFFPHYDPRCKHQHRILQALLPFPDRFHRFRIPQQTTDSNRT